MNVWSYRPKDPLGPFLQLTEFDDFEKGAS